MSANTYGMKERMLSTIAVGFGLVLLLYVAMGLSAISSMKSLQNISGNLYEHPFKVSLAVQEIKSSVIRIRERMLYMVLSGNGVKEQGLIDEISRLDSGIDQNLSILKASFLGDMDRVIDAERLVVAWRRERTAALDLERNGKRDEARGIVKERGTEVFMRLEADLDYVSRFAKNKAQTYADQAASEESATIRRIVWYLACLVAISGITAWYVLSKTSNMMRKSERLGEELLESRLKAESAQYTRSLIEASLDPLVTISLEGKITDVNEATVNATGATRAELMGSDFSDYFTEPEMARTGYLQVFEKGSVKNYPLTIRHRDGHLVDVLYNASVYRDERGEVLGVFAAARDITERKEAEQELAKLSLQNRLILDSAGEGIYGLDREGRCTFANPAAVQLLGFSVEELIGSHGHSLFHHTKPDGSPYPAEACPVQASHKQGVMHRGNDWYWHKSGKIFPVEYISTPIVEEGKVTGAVVMFSDITERKQAEEELKRYREHLEDLVKGRTMALESANERLKELDRLKSMFIASMSHELRTPLNSIIGFTGIILQGMAGDISPEQKKQLGIVKESAGHLLHLVNDVIDISKIEAGKAELLVEDFDLSGLVREVADSFSVEIRRKGLKFETDLPDILRIESDRRRIRQILFNLLGNAVKFTEKGKISVRMEKRRDGVEITVKDTGIGIREEDMGKLFTAFAQIVKGDVPKEGSGLGLYLSRKIAELLGGSISAESEFGRGSVFTFFVKGGA